MNDETELRESLRAYLKDHDAALSSGRGEAELNEWIERLDGFAPHANISDLYFWGERERTLEEIVDEAVRREQVWRPGGELALLLYLEAQLSSAAANADLLPAHRNYVDAELPRLREQVATLAGGSMH